MSCSHSTYSSSPQLLAPLLSDPNSEEHRVYFVLPRKPTEQEEEALHQAALAELDARCPMEPNTSRVVDFAYLGQIRGQDSSTPAVLAYYDSTEATHHGKDCLHSSCIGWGTPEEAVKHDKAPSRAALAMNRKLQTTLLYMCNDSNTWNGLVKDRWELGNALLGSHPSTRRFVRPIIVSEPDSMDNWSGPEYGMIPSEELYTPGLNKKRVMYKQHTGITSKAQAAETQVQVASSGRGRSRPQRYYDERRASSSLDVSTNEQEVGLGLIVVRQWEDGSRETDIQKRTDIRYHDPSDTNSLCRGWLRSDKCEKEASIALAGDNVKILNTRCHPGDGYNIEPGLLSAVERHYINEVSPLLLLDKHKYVPWSAILRFEDSEAGRIASSFPGMTSLLKNRLYGPDSSNKQLAALAPAEAQYENQATTGSATTPQAVRPSSSTTQGPSECPKQDASELNALFGRSNRQDTMSTETTRPSRRSTNVSTGSAGTADTELDDDPPDAELAEADGEESEWSYHRTALKKGMAEILGRDFDLLAISESPSQADQQHQ